MRPASTTRRLFTRGAGSFRMFAIISLPLDSFLLLPLSFCDCLLLRFLRFDPSISRIDLLSKAIEVSQGLWQSVVIQELRQYPIP